MPDIEMIGSVTRGRYEQLVAEAQSLIEQASRGQFRLGEMALEIEPLRPHGGSQVPVGEDSSTVDESLRWFADDLGISPHTIKGYRWVASRWPANKQAVGVPHHIHAILASKEDDVATSTPLIWDYDNGYRLSTGVDNCTTYIVTAYSSLVTRAGRLMSGIVGPHAAANPDDRQAQLFLELLNSVLRALSIAMDAASSPTTSG